MDRSIAVICPYCRADLGAAAVWCSVCGTGHHPACWAENGCRCTVFHCESRQTLAPAMPRAIARALEYALLAAPVLVFLAAFARRWVF